jgi:hypothetical protein
LGVENGGECGALWGVSYGSRQNSIEKVGGVCARDGEQCPVREACDAQSHVKGVHGPRDRNSDWGQIPKIMGRFRQKTETKKGRPYAIHDEICQTQNHAVILCSLCGKSLGDYQSF